MSQNNGYLLYSMNSNYVATNTTYAGLTVYQNEDYGTNFYNVGHVALNAEKGANSIFPTGPAMNVSDTSTGESPILVVPTSYRKVIASGNLNLLNPVPPNGYVSLGLVGAKDENFRCVRQDYVQRLNPNDLALVNTLQWNNFLVSVWCLPVSGAFIINYNKEKPGQPIYDLKDSL